MRHQRWRAVLNGCRNGTPWPCRMSPRRRPWRPR